MRWFLRLHGLAPLGWAASLPLLIAAVATAANKDLVVIHSERWIDTIKGTVKNLSADRAEDIVILVRFYGEPATSKPSARPRRTSGRSELGQQTTKVAPLDPGQEAPFEVEIAEKHRKATSYKFEPHAIWRKGGGARSGER